MHDVLRRYERIARWYDLLDLPFERRRYMALRPLVFEGLSGRVLDAGVGTGRNVAWYPPGAWVAGVDLSGAMLDRARRRALARGRPVALARMDLTRLAFADDSFGSAVATFVFCVLPDETQPAALAELARVVRPGGEVRLMEYVRPQGRLRGAVARLWAPWMAWAYGAGFDRRTERHIAGLGLEVIDSRYVVDDLVRLIRLRAP